MSNQTSLMHCSRAVQSLSYLQEVWDGEGGDPRLDGGPQLRLQGLRVVPAVLLQDDVRVHPLACTK